MFVRNLIRFVFVLLTQVLVLNNINLGVNINPAFYVYFILLLPFETAGWALLLSSFLMGLGVDFFCNSLGMNAAASVFVAFCRPGIIRFLKSRREYEPGTRPTIRDLGVRWFFSYAFISIVLLHTVLFFLETFGFENADQTLIRILLSSGAAFVLVILVQFLFGRRE
nr:rod shape-determining protein MreD [Bacteroidota bacterium]